MNYGPDVLTKIKYIQVRNPGFLLCGSAALIMCGVLPNRDMSDIDFVAHKADFEKTKLSLGYDEYSSLNHGPKYDSYSCYHGSIKINVLIFSDDIQLNTESFSISKPNMFRPFAPLTVRHQALQDIINWKEKYNRPKDIRDLDKITSKALEAAIL